MDCSKEITLERVAQRHVKAGICQDLQSAYNQVKNNDLVNADFILENSLFKDVIIISTNQGY